MRQAALLGNPDTKRTRYFMQAAEKAGVPVVFADWKQWRERLPDGEVFLKIDPPLWDSCGLDSLDGLAEDYTEQLAELSCMTGERYIKFLNHPVAIADLLDKRVCKKKLHKAGLSVTEQLAEESGACGDRTGAGELLERMRQQGMYQVFIKPVKGSGAAGVSAFRFQPATGKMALYTCALNHPALGLVNTRRLRRFSQPGEILGLLDRILQLDCVIERWYAKADYHGFSYDLRVVVQDGRMDFILARLSRGPITNLHLNNHPLDAADLALSEEVTVSVNELCRKAMECFPGLRSAGIDVLLEKGSLTPRIIEMNAQGDLIYQDIYHDNIIYRHQAEVMRKWMSAQLP